jgi:hypothetical protein
MTIGFKFFFHSDGSLEALVDAWLAVGWRLDGAVCFDLAHAPMVEVDEPPQQLLSRVRAAVSAGRAVSVSMTDIDDTRGDLIVSPEHGVMFLCTQPPTLPSGLPDINDLFQRLVLPARVVIAEVQLNYDV